MSEQSTSAAFWSSRFAFLMAAIGSAVGLGNFWRFPYLAGENGGGAFVLVYLISVVVIILPLLVAEILIGRRGGKSAVGSTLAVARSEKATPLWAVIGWMGMIAGFLILTFYSVIGGWVLDYIAMSAQGAFTGATPEEVQGAFEQLLDDPVRLITWHVIFMAATIGIVATGVTMGIERAVVVLMPLLFVMLIVMVLYSAMTGDFTSAVDFLLVPHFEDFTADSVLRAIGQGFFSVGIGVGLMITYGAYLRKDTPIASSALIIVLCDTAVAVLAGLAIFPIVFANGLDPAAGPGLMFVTLPIALGQMPLATLVATFFFVLIFIAAITSSISMLELTTAWTEDRGRIPRWASALGFGAVAFVIGLASVFSFNIWSEWYPLAFIPTFETRTFFDTLDYVTSNVMLPLGGILVALFVGWVVHHTSARDELGTDDTLLFRGWLFLLRFVCPLAIGWVLVANLT